MYLMSFTSPRQKRTVSRRGTVTVLVLIVILIGSVMLTQLVRRTLLDGRQASDNLLQLQAMELAEAAAVRAQQAWSDSEDWTGETWKLAPGQIHQTNEGEVVITVAEDVATITARYPANFSNPVQITRKVSLKQ